jgi:hypothetical protein
MRFRLVVALLLAPLPGCDDDEGEDADAGTAAQHDGGADAARDTGITRSVCYWNEETEEFDKDCYHCGGATPHDADPRCDDPFWGSDARPPDVSGAH